MDVDKSGYSFRGRTRMQSFSLQPRLPLQLFLRAPQSLCNEVALSQYPFIQDHMDPFLSQSFHRYPSSQTTSKSFSHQLIPLCVGLVNLSLSVNLLHVSDEVSTD